MLQTGFLYGGERSGQVREGEAGGGDGAARGDYVRLFRRESAVFEEALSILQVYLGFFMEPKDETGWES